MNGKLSSKEAARFLICFPWKVMKRSLFIYFQFPLFKKEKKGKKRKKKKNRPKTKNLRETHRLINTRIKWKLNRAVKCVKAKKIRRKEMRV